MLKSKDIHLDKLNFDFLKQSHVNLIYEIESKIFKEEAWSLASIQTEVNNPHSLNIVAVHENNIAGYIFTSKLYENIHINNFAISEKYRKNKIGFLMIMIMLKIARLENTEYATLEVRNSNTPAINLYKKIGFEKIATRKRFYKNPIEDAVVMGLHL